MKKENFSPLVSIVNVTWNGKGLLEYHLPSLDSINYANKEIFIVDNGSSDGSVDFVKKSYPHFKIIQNSTNLGTAEGSNVAIQNCSGKYIFWVSNDMEFDPEIVTRLVERCEGDHSIGICTVKMRRFINDKKTKIIDSVGASIDFLGFPSSVGINQNDYGQYDEFKEVFFSFGGALFIRRDLAIQTGGYDEAFLTLADDIDLSWRVRLLGFKVMVEPKALLYHRVSATLGKSHNRAEKRYISERNTLRTLLKNYSLLSLAIILPIYFLMLISESLFFVLIGKYGLSKSNTRAIFWNLANIHSTLKKRMYIQSSRKISDWKIFSKMTFFPNKLLIFYDFCINRNSQNWKNYF
jgi:GT2 family glycosyltransferase